MDDLRLREALRPLAESISTRTQLESERMVKEGFRDDGTLEENLITRALPWQRADVVIPGAAVAMSGAARVAFPQGGVIRHVSIFARTAPTSPFAITIAAGADSSSYSLQAGTTVQMSSANIAVAPGTWAVINVTNAGGAEDVMIILHYALSASGGSGSGGSGGGGGGGVGEVLSVNGQTGTVVLNADHIDDTSTSHKFATAAQLAKLDGINLSNYVLASSLALVATSGNYADLDNKPTLGTAAAMNASSFATAAQGAKADTAVQPGDLGDLATKDDVLISDIAASGSPSGTTYLRGDGTWSTPPSGGGGGAVWGSVTGTLSDQIDLKNALDAKVNSSALAGVALSGAYADLTGKPSIPTTLTALDTSVTGAQLNALKTKVDGIADGAEVNVNADWNAASGDAAILNKPSTFPPATHSHSWTSITGKPTTFPPSAHSHAWGEITGKPTTFPPSTHDHDERYYTQAQVDALIAANRPKVDSNAASMIVAISSTGDHELTTSAVTIPGLTPGASVKIIGEVMLRLIGTGSGGEATTGFKISNGATTTTFTFAFLPAAVTGQEQHSIRYATTITVPASGSVTLTPISRWRSGTYSVNYAMATLEVWPL